VTVHLPYPNYLVRRARPGGATLNLFFSCISWKRRDIIVNVIGSLCKVPVLFVCLQIKFNVFDILIESAPHKIFTHIYLVGAEMFCAKAHITKLKFAIRTFVLGGSLKIQFLPRREQNLYQIQEYMLNDV